MTYILAVPSDPGLQVHPDGLSFLVGYRLPQTPRTHTEGRAWGECLGSPLSIPLPPKVLSGWWPHWRGLAQPARLWPWGQPEPLPIGGIPRGSQANPVWKPGSAADRWVV